VSGTPVISDRDNSKSPHRCSQYRREAPGWKKYIERWEGTVVTAAVAGTGAGTSTQHEEARRGTFAALRTRNFRIYLAGQFIASNGTWMQTIAQDWLVLQLTHSPSAVGIAMALQFLPMLLFGMYGGVLADRYPKRRLLMITQSASGVLAALLAVLTISGEIRVGQVYLLALAGGLVFVVDNPTRQVFVNEVVPAADVRNAIALNSAAFQSARLIGPAVSGVLIGAVGCGWAFAANALCYLGPLIGLAVIRVDQLSPAPPLERAPGQLRATLRYVAARPHVAWTIALVGIIGTFGLNFPVVLTAMASTTFHGGAALYGAFNVALAVGSVTGALIAGGRANSRLRALIALGALFGLAQTAAAFAPALSLFLVALLAMGVSNLALQAMANSSVQLWIAASQRGRVMGLYALVFTGGTPLGGPLVGWITETFGPRAGMSLCGIVPLVAAAAIGGVLARSSRRSRSGPPPSASWPAARTAAARRPDHVIGELVA
jgi:MFS family permease